MGNVWKLELNLIKFDMKYQTLFKQSLSSRHILSWQRVLEHPRLAKSLFKKAILLVLDRITKELCISLHLFLVSVYRIGKISGWLYCALYLKQCMSSLKVAYGGGFDKSHPLPVRISLTRRGYPRLIPHHARKVMYRHDERADKLVQVYLTFFSFYTIILIGKKLTKSLFSSIREPIKDIDQVSMWLSLLKMKLPELIDRYIPGVSKIPLKQGMLWKPSWKTLPTYHSIKTFLWPMFPHLVQEYSPYSAQTMELAAYSSLLKFIHSYGEQWSSGILFIPRVRYALDVNNKMFSGDDLDVFEKTIGPHLPPWHPAMGPPMTGKLSQKVEGGGKRRIFAIGNWVNQRLLTPVHEWLASILRSLPMDGTYNQRAPLTRLRGSRINYCFDLTAATDRWPLVYMFEVMCYLFDRSFASAVVNSALACNIFFINFRTEFVDKSSDFIRFTRDVKMSNSWISFVAGQPLGYRSSWPLFALTHHILVWWCAEQVKPGEVFTDYALLGDDIVISNEPVALVYESALQYLQVKISKGKSLISKTGCAEFAKRFLVRDITVDLSPVTLKALLAVHLPLGRFCIAHHWNVVRYSTYRRIGGAGYKSCSRVPSDPDKMSDRERWEWTMWLQLKYPSLEWFFGEGKPLGPSEFWWVMRQILLSYKPPEFQCPPDDLFVSEDQRTFLEYTGLRSQFKDWLNYLQWWYRMYTLVYGYHSGYNPGVRETLNRLRILDILDMPFISGAWKINKNEVMHSRLSLLQKIYKRLRSHGPFLVIGNGVCGSLDPFDNDLLNQWCHCRNSNTLLYGVGEHPFLVTQEGLITPPEIRCRGCLYRTIKVTNSSKSIQI